MIARIFRGTAYPVRGLAFLARHRLWRYALIPIVINTLLWSLAVGLLFAYLDDVVTWVWPRPEPDAMLYELRVTLWRAVEVLVAVLAVGAALLLFTFTANLLAGPFNDALSERVEAIVRGASVVRPFQLADAVRAVANELRKLGFFLLVSLGLLALNLLPVLGSVLYAAVAPLFAAMFLTLEYLDLPLARRGFPFAQRWAAVWENKAVALGFGAVVTLGLLVPLASFVVIPAAVAGATLMFVDLERAGGLPR